MLNLSEWACGISASETIGILLINMMNCLMDVIGYSAINIRILETGCSLVNDLFVKHIISKVNQFFFQFKKFDIFK